MEGGFPACPGPVRLKLHRQSDQTCRKYCLRIPALAHGPLPAGITIARARQLLDACKESITHAEATALSARFGNQRTPRGTGHH